MKKMILKALAVASVLSPAMVFAQTANTKPTTATYIMKDEVDKVSATEQSKRVIDENTKVVDIGYEHFTVGVIHRASTRTPPPPPAAGRCGRRGSACRDLRAEDGYSSSWRDTGRHRSRLPNRGLLHRLRRRNDVHRRLHRQRTAKATITLREGRTGQDVGERRMK